MVLKAGDYIVTSKLTDSTVGQERPEDRSGGPKKVVLFPSDSFDHDVFSVEPQGNSQYVLKLGGEPLVAIDRQLYTSPSTKNPAEKWVITQHAYHGPYTIETADRTAGWKIIDDLHPSGHIAVRPLVRLPGYPPRYPSDELFNFTPVETSHYMRG
ncbi:hypothetical protein BV22DRAFT_1197609 [Leucogyrophana mollusca]|uniref:Uncharacterized protein n=1 Tax=Leucogyrophana mollusca TaxID=85980 RepID=A0ACB8BBG9_9AGAM|nr:hypothetical protein BV22DRAFT_1197609 [Leucogyrophana mollusca]